MHKVPAHPWMMRLPWCAPCHASIAVSHSSPLREGRRGWEEPVLLADVLVEVEHRVADCLLTLGFEDVDRGEQFAQFVELAD